MKITLLQGAFLPVPALRGGAVEKMWFGLGQEFASLGHQVTHVSRLCDGLPAEQEIGGVRHRRLRGFDRAPTMRVNLWLDLRYTLRALRRAPDADILVTNTFWAPILGRRRTGVLYVDVQRMPRGQMRFYGRAGRLRANSSAVAAAIVAEAPKMVDKIHVIPNPLPNASLRAIAWGAKQKNVLFAGRIHPEKGIELLLAAWDLVRRQRQLEGWTLTLLGPIKISEGGGGEPWKAELRQRYPRSDVIWRDPLYDEAALASAYESATVFAYPSLADKGETFGVAVLEAMAWGAVPVVSDLACFGDFVVPGKNGFSFPRAQGAPALAAALLEASQPAATSLGRNAVAVRKSHSSPAIARQFLADFESLR